ncbi:hypothetical protein B1992_08415 [Pseudoxanthomonas broegbernensis]|uniref:Uncharacterized protein n=1 Tax=Pseudoxanthomonas broegbernensis TaxID=83619 RepID=A0A7V8GM41_9GAMM|nr:hypothetical protein [Pseudoxanthomonas broegbernensis]KAF1686246.1 hypothetical protein B1992_08415 [Pseudoxanthomonas broegbernensis]MBB6063918.1 hypothetical protein [Pseudoxanthomonas broegbernensis]
MPADQDDDALDPATLTVAWWQWAMALPIEPMLDVDGSMCELGDFGPVWFLAGTDGIRDDITRTCQIPLGARLLVPVATRYIARTFAPRKGDPVPGCEHLQDQAAMPPEGLLQATVTLDGVDVGPVAERRIRSPGCFDPYPWLPAPEDKPPPLAASDGYWFLLEPLPPGEHVLEVNAHYRREGQSGFEIVQRYRYVLRAGMGARYVGL